MPDLGPAELLVIGVVVIVLFGSAKLPKAARSLGQSLRIFKAETAGLTSSEPAPVAPVAASTVPAPAPVAAPVAVVAEPIPAPLLTPEGHATVAPGRPGTGDSGSSPA